MERKFFGEEFIAMRRPRFIQEHENLIRVLETGDPKELKKEAKEQKKELRKELKKGKKAAK
jgi:hypothetical protein